LPMVYPQQQSNVSIDSAHISQAFFHKDNSFQIVLEKHKPYT